MSGVPVNVLEQHMRCNGQIVQNAETGGVVIVRMVGAASQVTGQALMQGQLSGKNRTGWRQ